MQNNVDMIQSGELKKSSLLVRSVRLGPSIQHIIAQHKYPEAISKLLIEALTLVSLLKSSLKFSGVLTLQVKDGRYVPLLVADVTHEGHLRGFARFPKELPDATSEDLLAEGFLVLTLDQTQGQRYQGIVAIPEGGGIIDALEHYFIQSEQLPTAFAFAMAETPWSSGAIMLQKMPSDETDEEPWQRACLFLKTVKEKELLDLELPLSELLFRLFHEEELHLLSTSSVQAQCRCTRERLVGLMENVGITPEAEEKEFTVTCDFCGSIYKIQVHELSPTKGGKND